MKKAIAASILAITASTAAYADTVDRIKIYDHTKIITNNAPVSETRCQEVKVPVYGQSSGATGGDVLAGMIIGGILGKAATGKDNGAGVGAVAGALIATDKANKNKVVGYQLQEQCSEVVVYRNSEVEVYSHSTIRFYLNGKRYVVPFQK